MRNYNLDVDNSDKVEVKNKKFIYLIKRKITFFIFRKLIFLFKQNLSNFSQQGWEAYNHLIKSYFIAEHKGVEQKVVHWSTTL